MAAGERPKRLGRFEILTTIGSGGMAAIYLARIAGPAGFERPIALKVIHEHLASESRFVEMFLNEARIAAQLQHPNITQIYELGEADGTYFIAMEYLRGEHVGAIIHASRSSGRTGVDGRIACQVAMQVCEGLHHAHSSTDVEGRPLDVVHRDVSPQNLFVTYTGAVKVMDFGIARAAGMVSTTRPGAVKGKASYMAPEQVQGDVLDERTDVFALGIVLWEMLLGRRLFHGVNELASMRLVIEGKVPRIADIRPTIPEEIDEVLAQAMASDRSERFSTAMAFHEALSPILDDLGGPLSTHELAEHMRDLFPDEEKKKKALLLHTMSDETNRSTSGDSAREVWERVVLAKQKQSSKLLVADADEVTLIDTPESSHPTATDETISSSSPAFALEDTAHQEREPIVPDSAASEEEGFAAQEEAATIRVVSSRRAEVDLRKTTPWVNATVSPERLRGLIAEARTDDRDEEEALADMHATTRMDGSAVLAMFEAERGSVEPATQRSSSPEAEPSPLPVEHERVTKVPAQLSWKNRARGSVILIGGIFVAMLAVGAGYFLMTSNWSPTPTVPTEGILGGEPDSDLHELIIGGSGRSDGSAGRSQAQAQAQDGQSATLSIHVTPSGALLVLDGVPLGRSPLDLTRPASRAEHELRLEAEGHIPVVRTIRFGQSRRLEIHLRPTGEVR